MKNERCRMAESLLLSSGKQSALTVVFDDRCPLVASLAGLVRLWDRRGSFSIIGRKDASERRQLIDELDRSPWSLLLLDDASQRWTGPEAIPIILKNLPFGKIAAVAYILPGTMWLTRQLYLLVSRVSRNRRKSASVSNCR